MDTPPPILGYESSAASVRLADDAVTLRPPPPGWEMVLLGFAMSAMAGGTLLGVLFAIQAATRPDFARFMGSLIFTSFTTLGAHHYYTEFSKRRRFGHLPCTFRRDGPHLLIDYPARWPNASHRWEPGDASRSPARVKIRRKGWASNLQPLFQLQLTHGHSSPIKLLFVISDPNDAATVQQRLAEMLKDIERDQHA